jgi:hypothetical protein
MGWSAQPYDREVGFLPTAILGRRCCEHRRHLVSRRHWRFFYTRGVGLLLMLAIGSMLLIGSSCAAASVRTCCTPGEPHEDCDDATEACEPGASEKVKNAVKNLPQLGTIIAEARTTRDVEQVFRHLEKYHGIDRRLASERLHDIKSKNGLPNDTDLIFDMTGNVYSPTTLELLGSMTQGGAKLIR